MKKADTRRYVRFSCESLELSCEWENCTVVKNEMPAFISHITYEHLNNLCETHLHCLWRECDGLFKTVAELRRHVLFHAFHTKIKCFGKNLQLRKDLPNCPLGNSNRNEIPDLPEPFMCCWGECRDVIEGSESFYRHVDAHIEYDCQPTKKSQTKCLWAECGRSFADQYKVKEHIKSHTQEKVIACPVCGGMFSSRTKFFDHIKRQVPTSSGGKEYVCEYCLRKWQSERLLRDHMRAHVNHYKCPCCDMTCATPSGLKNHMAYRHCDAKPFSCQYCEYQCKKPSDLRKHLETHDTTAPFVCPKEGCDYFARSHTSYKKHILVEHDNEKVSKYACHLCPKVTTRGNYLTKHLIKKHNFNWPSGHCRFRYHQHEGGFFRLQTVRYESLELSEAFIDDDEEKEHDPDDPDKATSSSNAFENNDPSPTIGNDLPVIMYMQSENLQPISVISSVNDKMDQQGIVLQVVDASGKPLATADSSLLLSKPVHIDKSQTIQIIETNASGETVCQTAHIIANGPFLQPTLASTAS